jgi:hypothetical protein
MGVNVHGAEWTSYYARFFMDYYIVLCCTTP